MSKQLTIVTAESCTGGLVASLLTNLPGSSAWFDRGFVVYSNLAKVELLNVPIDLIHRYGAVSREVAIKMAVGALHHSHAQISLAITGIAGPTGGEPTKPIGTVWCAFANRESSTNAKCFSFYHQSREKIRRLASLAALQHMLEFIKGK